MHCGSILIVDGDAGLPHALSDLLDAAGFIVREAGERRRGTRSDPARATRAGRARGRPAGSVRLRDLPPAARRVRRGAPDRLRLGREDRSRSIRSRACSSAATITFPSRSSPTCCLRASAGSWPAPAWPRTSSGVGFHPARAPGALTPRRGPAAAGDRERAGNPPARPSASTSSTSSPSSACTTRRRPSLWRSAAGSSYKMSTRNLPDQHANGHGASAGEAVVQATTRNRTGRLRWPQEARARPDGARVCAARASCSRVAHVLLSVHGKRDQSAGASEPKTARSCERSTAARRTSSPATACRSAS